MDQFTIICKPQWLRQACRLAVGVCRGHREAPRRICIGPIYKHLEATVAQTSVPSSSLDSKRAAVFCRPGPWVTMLWHQRSLRSLSQSPQICQFASSGFPVVLCPRLGLSLYRLSDPDLNLSSFQAYFLLFSWRGLGGFRLPTAPTIPGGGCATPDPPCFIRKKRGVWGGAAPPESRGVRGAAAPRFRKNRKLIFF